MFNYMPLYALFQPMLKDTFTLNSGALQFFSLRKWFSTCVEKISNDESWLDFLPPAVLIEFQALLLFLLVPAAVLASMSRGSGP
jgi:hypothetical protein